MKTQAWQAASGLTYKIDDHLNILRQRWRGAVTKNDVAEFWRALLLDARTLMVGRHLNDLRDCRLEFSGNEWLDLVVRYLESGPVHAAWKAAIVVNGVETLGVVNQFIRYAGDLVTAKIFDDMDEAETWLLSGEST